MVEEMGPDVPDQHRTGPAGRSAGSLAWAGLNNTYYWLDPVKKVAGVLMTQVLPFADQTVLDALDRVRGCGLRVTGVKRPDRLPRSNAEAPRQGGTRGGIGQNRHGGLRLL